MSDSKNLSSQITESSTYYNPSFSELTIKILLVGDSSVGKDDIFKAYFGVNSYEKIMHNTGLYFEIKRMVIDEKPIKLQVWDTLGQEQYRTITKAFLRGADGIFLIFDYTNKSSFEMLGDWMDSIIKNSDGHITVFLIGNKCDQEKVVSQDEVLKFKAKYDLPLFEMSAKSNINVNETFFEAGKIIKERKEREAKEKKEEAEAQAQVAEDKKPKKKTNKEACNVY